MDSGHRYQGPLPPLHDTTLHYTTLHYTTLHCTALHCTALHCTALHCTTLHYTTRHISLHRNYTGPSLCIACHMGGRAFHSAFLSSSRHKLASAKINYVGSGSISQYVVVLTICLRTSINRCGMSDTGALQFWVRELAEVPPICQVPTDFRRPAVKRDAAGTVAFTLASDASGRMAQLADRIGADMQDVLLAAFLVLLTRYTREDHIVVGLTGATDDLGLVHVHLSGNPTFEDHLQQTVQAVAQAAGHAAPLLQIAKALGHGSSGGAFHPVVQVLRLQILPDLSPGLWKCLLCSAVQCSAVQCSAV